MKVRRVIVTQDAQASPAIIIEAGIAGWRLRNLITER